ncbi:MAG: hypothetical protein ACFB5Z_14735 [Elainellaceae cyanobacterium]
MSQSEIIAALQAAFDQCHTLGQDLTAVQQQILRQTLLQHLGVADNASQRGDNSSDNPLDELTAEERQRLIRYIQAQAGSTAWKIALLNDWLSDRNSGDVQFIRDRYGLQWLDRVEQRHLAPDLDDGQVPLSVGDRIEVSNGLWEWVQEQGPCAREWVACQVVSLSSSGSAVVRFENGMEYEIQGIYDWNRYQWRRSRG